MTKNTTRQKTAEQETTEAGKKPSMKRLRQRAAAERLTIGLDLGDRHTHYCWMQGGEVLVEHKLPTSKAGRDGLLAELPRCRVAMEVGTHSGWVSRHIGKLGHEAFVAHARRIAWFRRAGERTTGSMRGSQRNWRAWTWRCWRRSGTTASRRSRNWR